MDLSVKSQTVLFFLSIFLGAGIGYLFDFIKVFRIEFKKSRIVTVILDVLFIFICGVFSILFLFYMNGIELRIFLIIGILIGITLYFLVFSNFLFKLNKFILKFLLKSLEILLYPVKFLCKIVYMILKMIKLPVLSLVKFFKKRIKGLKISFEKLSRRRKKV